jgi:cytidylate kinase
MRKINIAIDGHSACGKSSTAKAVAKVLGYTYVDSGAMYRAATYYFIENNITRTNPKEIDQALSNIKISFVVNSETGLSETFLNGLRIEDEIRKMEVTEAVSEVSAISSVRKAMVAEQRKMARKKGIVMDGRDIGSVVLPDAELKVFMTADQDVRTERRQKELFEKDVLVDFDVVKENILKRDKIDSSREDSPLVQAEDAKVVDNTFMTFDEQVDKILGMASAKIAESSSVNLGNSDS